jgi:hypothetical protein
VAKGIPTQIGDVLILWTDHAFTIYVVGDVSTDDQQDFHGQQNARYISDRAVAVAAAKTLVVPGRRIFIRNIDTDDWSEIPSDADKGKPMNGARPIDAQASRQPRPNETDEIARRLKRDTEARVNEVRRRIAASKQKLKRKRR